MAVQEALAVYRVRGRNLFHSPGAEFSAERTERRIETFGILTRGMKAWLEAKGYDLKERNLRALLDYG